MLKSNIYLKGSKNTGFKKEIKKIIKKLLEHPLSREYYLESSPYTLRYIDKYQYV